MTKEILRLCEIFLCHMSFILCDINESPDNVFEGFTSLSFRQCPTDCNVPIQLNQHVSEMPRCAYLVILLRYLSSTPFRVAAKDGIFQMKCEVHISQESES